jgi:hypothetical protein
VVVVARWWWRRDPDRVGWFDPPLDDAFAEPGDHDDRHATAAPTRLEAATTATTDRRRGAGRSRRCRGSNVTRVAGPCGSRTDDATNGRQDVPGHRIGCFVVEGVVIGHERRLPTHRAPLAAPGVSGRAISYDGGCTCHTTRDTWVGLSVDPLPVEEAARWAVLPSLWRGRAVLGHRSRPCRRAPRGVPARVRGLHRTGRAPPGGHRRRAPASGGPISGGWRCCIGSVRCRSASRRWWSWPRLPTASRVRCGTLRHRHLKSTVPIWKREHWDGGQSWGLEAQHLVDVSTRCASRWRTPLRAQEDRRESGQFLLIALVIAAAGIAHRGHAQPQAIKPESAMDVVPSRDAGARAP